MSTNGLYYSLTSDFNDVLVSYLIQYEIKIYQTILRWRKWGLGWTLGTHDVLAQFAQCPAGNERFQTGVLTCIMYCQYTVHQN